MPISLSAGYSILELIEETVDIDYDVVNDRSIDLDNEFFTIKELEYQIEVKNLFEKTIDDSYNGLFFIIKINDLSFTSEYEVVVEKDFNFTMDSLFIITKDVEFTNNYRIFTIETIDSDIIFNSILLNSKEISYDFILSTTTISEIDGDLSLNTKFQLDVSNTYNIFHINTIDLLMNLELLSINEFSVDMKNHIMEEDIEKNYTLSYNSIIEQEIELGISFDLNLQKEIESNIEYNIFNVFEKEQEIEFNSVKDIEFFIDSNFLLTSIQQSYIETETSLLQEMEMDFDILYLKQTLNEIELLNDITFIKEHTNEYLIDFVNSKVSEFTFDITNFKIMENEYSITNDYLVLNESSFDVQMNIDTILQQSMDYSTNYELILENNLNYYLNSKFLKTQEIYSDFYMYTSRMEEMEINNSYNVYDKIEILSSLDYLIDVNQTLEFNSNFILTTKSQFDYDGGYSLTVENQFDIIKTFNIVQSMEKEMDSSFIVNYTSVQDFIKTYNVIKYNEIETSINNFVSNTIEEDYGFLFVTSLPQVELEKELSFNIYFLQDMSFDYDFNSISEMIKPIEIPFILSQHFQEDTDVDISFLFEFEFEYPINYRSIQETVLDYDSEFRTYKVLEKSYETIYISVQEKVITSELPMVIQKTSIEDYDGEILLSYNRTFDFDYLYNSISEFVLSPEMFITNIKEVEKDIEIEYDIHILQIPRLIEYTLQIELYHLQGIEFDTIYNSVIDSEIQFNMSSINSYVNDYQFNSTYNIYEYTVLETDITFIPLLQQVIEPNFSFIIQTHTIMDTVSNSSLITKDLEYGFNVVYNSGTERVIEIESSYEIEIVKEEREFDFGIVYNIYDLITLENDSSYLTITNIENDFTLFNYNILNVEKSFINQYNIFETKSIEFNLSFIPIYNRVVTSEINYIIGKTLEDSYDGSSNLLFNKQIEFETIFEIEYFYNREVSVDNNYLTIINKEEEYVVYNLVNIFSTFENSLNSFIVKQIDFDILTKYDLVLHTEMLLNINHLSIINKEMDLSISHYIIEQMELQVLNTFNTSRIINTSYNTIFDTIRFYDKMYDIHLHLVIEELIEFQSLTHTIFETTLLNNYSYFINMNKQDSYFVGLNLILNQIKSFEVQDTLVVIEKLEDVNINNYVVNEQLMSIPNIIDTIRYFELDNELNYYTIKQEDMIYNTNCSSIIDNFIILPQHYYIISKNINDYGVQTNSVIESSMDIETINYISLYRVLEYDSISYSIIDRLSSYDMGIYVIRSTPISMQTMTEYNVIYNNFDDYLVDLSSIANYTDIFNSSYNVIYQMTQSFETSIQNILIKSKDVKIDNYVIKLNSIDYNVSQNSSTLNIYPFNVSFMNIDVKKLNPLLITDLIRFGSYDYTTGLNSVKENLLEELIISKYFIKNYENGYQIEFKNVFHNEFSFNKLFDIVKYTEFENSIYTKIIKLNELSIDTIYRTIESDQYIDFNISFNKVFENIEEFTNDVVFIKTNELQMNLFNLNIKEKELNVNVSFNVIIEEEFVKPINYRIVENFYVDSFITFNSIKVKKLRLFPLYRIVKNRQKWFNNEYNVIKMKEITLSDIRFNSVKESTSIYDLISLTINKIEKSYDINWINIYKTYWNMDIRNVIKFDISMNFNVFCVHTSQREMNVDFKIDSISIETIKTLTFKFVLFYCRDTKQSFIKSQG